MGTCHPGNCHRPSKKDHDYQPPDHCTASLWGYFYKRHMPMVKEQVQFFRITTICLRYQNLDNLRFSIILSMLKNGDVQQLNFHNALRESMIEKITTKREKQFRFTILLTFLENLQSSCLVLHWTNFGFGFTLIVELQKLKSLILWDIDGFCSIIIYC